MADRLLTLWDAGKSCFSGMVENNRMLPSLSFCSVFSLISFNFILQACSALYFIIINTTDQKIHEFSVNIWLFIPSVNTGKSISYIGCQLYQDVFTLVRIKKGLREYEHSDGEGHYYLLYVVYCV